MKSKGVKRYSLSKQVADKLEHMIETGEYAIGEKIPTEVELMEIFEVSRNTLREAIQSLTLAGLLEVRQGDGTYVRSNNRFHANMNMEYARVSLENIQEVRYSIEIAIAHFAARRRTEEDLVEIEAALRRRSDLKETSKENTIADMEFHMAIAKASHNRVFFDLYHSISAYLESHIAERQAETDLNFAEIDRLHEELYLAIKAQDADVAGICAQNILKI